MTIGYRIKILREENGLSQEELAKRLGYKSRTSIHKIEQDITDLPLSKVNEFSQALNTTPAYLMGWDEKENKHEKTPALTKKEKIDIGKDVERLISGLDSDASLSFELDGHIIDDELKEILKNSLQNTLEYAKLKSKEKYAPNKFKNR